MLLFCNCASFLFCLVCISLVPHLSSLFFFSLLNSKQHATATVAARVLHPLFRFCYCLFCFFLFSKAADSVSHSVLHASDPTSFFSCFNAAYLKKEEKKKKEAVCDCFFFFFFFFFLRLSLVGLIRVFFFPFCVSMFTYTYIYTYIYTCIYVCVCVYICMCVCVQST